MTQNLKAWQVEYRADFAQLSNEAQLKHLSEWGVLAASAHNSQPWRLVLNPAQRQIRLCVDLDGLTPASDAAGRESTIGIGCCVETLRTAAEAYGLRVGVTLFDATLTAEATLAQLDFGPTDGPPAPAQSREVFRSIRERRMNRSRYDMRAVPEAFMHAARAVGQEQGLTVDFITDTPTRYALAELQALADRTVIAAPAFRHELERFFLANDSLEPRGMPGATFGLGDSVSAQIKRDLGQPGLFNPDWVAGFASAGREGMRSAPLLVVASVTKDTPVEWLKTGIFFQRSILEAQRQGLSVAVHAALVESAGLNTMLRARLGRLVRPTMVFRVGYATEQRPHAPRILASVQTRP